VTARKYATAAPAVTVGAVIGLIAFIIALISGASFALALALGGGGGVVFGAIFAARQNPERLLPLACVAGAGALFASELMTTFQLSTNTGGVCNIDALPRHYFALGILAIFAVIAVVIAVVGASKPAAIAVGIAGVIALILFLTIDLPHANNAGTVEGCSEASELAFTTAKAIPQAGFWLEMVGALSLALSGVALGTLNPDQLRAIRPRWLGGSRPSEETGSEPDGSGPVTGGDPQTLVDSGNDNEAAATRRRARARTRDRPR
jgi:hypothetical protein